MTTDAPNQSSRLFHGLALLLAFSLVAYALVRYQQAVTREQAAELEAHCVEPATGTFSLKLACIPRRVQ